MSFLRLSNFHILFVCGVFLYLLGILIFNADRGFDVTDESYYILGAMYPFDVFSVLTNENYYIGLLFYLSGYNLAIFRIFGIIVLSFSSFLFSLELYKYIVNEFNLNYSFEDKIYFILIIIISSLGYYVFWLLTPSYNWLSVVSMLLIVVAMLKTINKSDTIRDRLLCVEYFYLGFSLSLLFMAKPTSLLGLLPAFILFYLFHYKEVNFIRLTISVLLIFILLVALQIIFFHHEFSSYINNLIEIINRYKILNSGHDMKNIISSMYYSSISIISKIDIFKITIFLFFSLLFFRYLYFKKKMIEYLSYLFTILFAFLLYKSNILPFSIIFNSYIFSFTLFIFIISIYFITNNLNKNNLKIFLKVFLIVIFLFYISIAISFGTNGDILIHARISYVFPAAGLISLAFILDKKYSEIKNLKIVVGIIIAIFVFKMLNMAYEKPYLLNTSIRYQTEKIDILGGLKVDLEQKKYITDLLNIKKTIKNLDEPIFLIDTTGATPGANVVLDAKFFQHTWIFGHYTGSNAFAYRILSNIGINELNKAWILTSSNGSFQLDFNLFSRLNLNFPEGYIKVTDLYLKNRNENQQLWIPKIKINQGNLEK